MNRKKSLFTFFEQRIKKVLILTLAIGSFAFVSSANAALLNLTLKQSPDINVGFINSEYDSGLGVFTATGFATNYLDGVTPGGINIAGTFDLTANIDTAGMLTAAGSGFTITGDIGSGQQTLLVGELTNVGFDMSSTLLEFEYTATSGALASVFSGTGGIIMNGVGITPALFASNFNNPTPGRADVGKIPEPLSVLLFGAGLLALGVRQRRGNTI